MCGETVVSPYSAYKIPPALVEEMAHSEDVLAEIGETPTKLSVDLCEGCSDIASRMVTEYETSPLPECDARHLQIPFAVHSPDHDPAIDQNDLTARMIEDALVTAKASADGNADHLRRSKLVEARVIVLSAQNLGLLGETPF